MTEAIKMREKRQQALKDLILDLHAGRAVDEVKERFARLLQGVGAGEIAELEQALIAEGLPEEEIKRLCDVHVAVFRESLEAQAAPETIPGHPVYTFRAENAAVQGVLGRLQEAVAGLPETPDEGQLSHARERLRELREYERHYLRKENILFPYLERHGFPGPTHVMWAIHDDVRADWRALEELLVAGPRESPAGWRTQVETLLRRLNTTIREMIFKEENILYPASLERLTPQEWAEVRRQEPALGYSYVEPGDQWIPGTDVRESATAGAGEVRLAASGEDLVRMKVGVVSVAEINRLFAHMPVDITYVDKDDRVRFFSQGRDAIFPRSPAVIGRQVQLCHPPASVHRVQQILDDFRAGRRDVAEFWIQMRGRFVHIRYFALRGEEGDYQGVMEVVQDITEIRTLEGERRLLDEGG